MTASVSVSTGVDPVTPVDVTAGASSATAATVLNAPSVTTTGTYRQIVGVYGTRIAAAFTPDAGVAERADRSSTGTGAVTISVTDRPVTTAGATGTTTTTATAAGVHALITVALRPLATVETHRYVNTGVTSAVATAAGAVIERTVPLPGGVMVTKRAPGMCGHTRTSTATSKPPRTRPVSNKG